MSFPISRASVAGNYVITVLTAISITAQVFVFTTIASAQEKLAPPTGLRIIATPTVNPKAPGDQGAKTHLLRRAGPFYEMPVNITEKESHSMPIVRNCDRNTLLKIDSVDDALYTATFFVNSIKMGSPFLFQRNWFSPNKWSGGANITPRSCSIGVIVDSCSHRDHDYEVYLITTHNGIILFPDGIQFYPKVQNSGGVSCQEPRIWLSPDDTIAMIIAAAGEIWKPDSENTLAHFIDLNSGQTLDKVLFMWPHPTTSATPYAADLEIVRANRRIVFRVENKVTARVALP